MTDKQETEFTFTRAELEAGAMFHESVASVAMELAQYLADSEAGKSLKLSACGAKCLLDLARSVKRQTGAFPQAVMCALEQRAAVCAALAEEGFRTLQRVTVTVPSSGRTE